MPANGGALQHYLCSTSFMDAQVRNCRRSIAVHSRATRLSSYGPTMVGIWAKSSIGTNARLGKNPRGPLDRRRPGTGQENQTCSQPASLVDLFPTLIELCSLPTLDSQTLDGVSLVPWLIDPKRIRIFPPSLHELQHISVRNEMYRLIQYNDGSREL